MGYQLPPLDGRFALEAEAGLRRSTSHPLVEGLGTVDSRVLAYPLLFSVRGLAFELGRFSLYGRVGAGPTYYNHRATSSFFDTPLVQQGRTFMGFVAAQAVWRLGAVSTSSRCARAVPPRAPLRRCPARRSFRLRGPEVPVMSKRFILVLATVLSACEPTSPPLEAFHILDVAPLTQKTNESKRVRVQLDTDPAFLVDYGEPAARMVGQPRMVIGPHTLPLTYLGHGLLEGTVEPLTEGNYIVGVNLGDGREATFATPYVVTPEPPPEPEPEPSPDPWATYDFSRIEPQVQGQAFTVTITVTVHGQVESAPPTRAPPR
ncbi:hypothetical protein ACN28S_23180 [Cystobacter fuscus]